jgi:hypothetical protein
MPKRQRPLDLTPFRTSASRMVCQCGARLQIVVIVGVCDLIAGSCGLAAEYGDGDEEGVGEGEAHGKMYVSFEVGDEFEGWEGFE